MVEWLFQDQVVCSAYISLSLLWYVLREREADCGRWYVVVLSGAFLVVVSLFAAFLTGTSLLGLRRIMVFHVEGILPWRTLVATGYLLILAGIVDLIRRPSNDRDQ